MRKWIWSILLSLLLTTALPIFAQGTAATTALPPFADVPTDHWANNAIMELARTGIIEGVTAQDLILFQGDRPLTRYEMAVALARIVELVDKQKASKTNANVGASISPETLAAIKKLILTDPALREALRGPQGADGPQGAVGQQGAVGPQGAAAEAVTTVALAPPVAVTAQPATAVPASPPSANAPLQGAVTVIEPKGMFYISIGQREQLNKKAQLLILRNGDVIGEARVLKVELLDSLAVVKAGGRTLTLLPGDQVIVKNNPYVAPNPRRMPWVQPNMSQFESDLMLSLLTILAVGATIAHN